MCNHRNPRQRLSKQPSPDNFDPGTLIQVVATDRALYAGGAL
ncbi:MAG TPA: hypothetical protein VF469_06250 [Kofleriaceae bacterium]